MTPHRIQGSLARRGVVVCDRVLRRVKDRAADAMDHGRAAHPAWTTPAAPRALSTVSAALAEGASTPSGDATRRYSPVALNSLRCPPYQDDCEWETQRLAVLRVINSSNFVGCYTATPRLRTLQNFVDELRAACTALERWFQGNKSTGFQILRRVSIGSRGSRKSTVR